MEEKSSLPKRLLHRAAIIAERLFECIRPPATIDDGVVIEPYLGYATSDALIVRGRVLTALRRAEPDPRQSRWTNIRQMAALFLTDEVAGVEVMAAGRSARTDEEGYFTLCLPRADTASGWVEVPVGVRDVAESETLAPVLVQAPDARFAIISDIDDTVLKTGAYSLARNVWTTLSGNALTRRVFPDAVEFIAGLGAGGRNPVFYVSSSPWNLHAFLDDLFRAHGLVRGPIFLRDLGISENRFVKGSHGEHKSAAIDTLMAAMPDLAFVLVGDTGQHDAEVYAETAARWPGRVAAVVLRRPTSRLSSVVEPGLARLESLDVPAFVTKDFSTVAADVRALIGNDD